MNIIKRPLGFLKVTVASVVDSRFTEVISHSSSPPFSLASKARLNASTVMSADKPFINTVSTSKLLSSSSSFTVRLLPSRVKVFCFRTFSIAVQQYVRVILSR